MSVKEFLIKHSGDVSVVAGIGGFVATVFFAIKAAPKAKDKVDKYELETNQKAKFKDKVKLTWKLWIPTAVVGVTSTAAVVGGVVIKNKKATILTTALAASQASMSKYQQAVIDKIGVDAEREIHQDYIAKSAPQTVISNAAYDEDSEANCWDAITQQPFKASVADIKLWMADANNSRVNGSFDTVYLNDYFDRFGIRNSALGDKLIWDLAHPVDIYIDSILVKNKSYILVEPRGYIMEG